ncbi:MAG: EamA family transporter, partial [Desulfomonile tiedjei]|nr:EamA family transporter [Desulfomonile tiedjei]
KALFESGLLPLDLVQIRVTFSSLLLAAVFAVYSRSLLRISPRDIGYFLVLGGVIMALVQFTYFYTISKIQVVAAILLQYLSPIIVAFFSMLFWGEKPTLFKFFSMFLAIAGTYLVVGGYNLDLLRMNRIGILVGLASALLYSAYTLLGERATHRYAPWTVVFYSMLFAALSLNVFYAPFNYLWAGYTAEQWCWILYVVIIGTVLPFGLYFVGINYVRSTRAMITATLEPISAGIMAYFFLGERLEALQLLGSALVVAAITLLQLNREQDALSPEAVRSNEEESGRNLL